MISNENMGGLRLIGAYPAIVYILINNTPRA